MFVTASLSHAVTELRPDLTAVPAYSVNIFTDASGRKLLRFSTRSWNSGSGPLELRAGETTDPNCVNTPDTSDCKQNVYQRVYLSDGGYYDRLAGTFVWHPQHNHFHFDKYAVYTLKPVNAPGGSARISEKTTFCIIDTDAVNTTLPGAPQQAVYTTCGVDTQGMSVGWADTYHYTQFGQNFDITGLPNGDYSISIEVNYGGKILEATGGSNVSCMLVRLNVTNSTVQVLNANSCTSSVVVSSISPTSASRNLVTAVTISGAGFTPGMAVSFGGGPGRPPTASNVVVDPNSGGTKITANVTVSKKAKAGSLWDVHVGSGVLPSGFRVQ